MISSLALNGIIRKHHNRINGYLNSIKNSPINRIVTKEYSPIRPTDIPLEKYLKLKKAFLLKKGNSEKIRNSRVIF